MKIKTINGFFESEIDGIKVLRRAKEGGSPHGKSLARGLELHSKPSEKGVLENGVEYTYSEIASPLAEACRQYRIVYKVREIFSDLYRDVNRGIKLGDGETRLYEDLKKVFDGGVRDEELQELYSSVEFIKSTPDGRGVDYRKTYPDVFPEDEEEKGMISSEEEMYSLQLTVEDYHRIPQELKDSEVFIQFARVFLQEKFGELNEEGFAIYDKADIYDMSAVELDSQLRFELFGESSDVSEDSETIFEESSDDDVVSSEDSETPEIICRSEYVASAFSLQMLENTIDFSIQGTEISEKEFIAVKNDCYSVVGHEDTARVLGVPFNRESITLKKGDVVYVAQLEGGRLAEGATELPEGYTFRYIKVEVKK